MERDLTPKLDWPFTGVTEVCQLIATVANCWYFSDAWLHLQHLEPSLSQTGTRITISHFGIKRQQESDRCVGYNVTVLAYYRSTVRRTHFWRHAIYIFLRTEYLKDIHHCMHSYANIKMVQSGIFILFYLNSTIRLLKTTALQRQSRFWHSLFILFF